MSGVLTRLLARATGATSGGLRPRSPSRFETPAPEAPDRPLAETTETVATATAAPGAPTHEGAEAPPSERDRTRLSAPPSTMPVPDPLAATVAAPLQPLHRQNHVVESRAADASRSTSARPAGRFPTIAAAPETARDPIAPAPALPSSPAHERAIETRPLAADPHRDARPVSMAPEPLLPESPRPSVAPPENAPGPSTPVAAAPSSGSRATPAEPPDIVISIGRIEIRAAPESARPRRPRRPPPELSRLGDYLGGGGGKR